MVSTSLSIHAALLLAFSEARFNSLISRGLHKVLNQPHKKTRLHSNRFDKKNSNKDLEQDQVYQLISGITTLVNVVSTCRLPGHLEESCMDFDSFHEDEMIRNKYWFDLKAPKVENLTMKITSQDYALPEFINRMDHLKVLSITGHGDHPSKLHNLSSIACLPNLATIKFEHVSVPSLQPVFALKNLKQLSFNMCEIGDALMSFTSESPHTMQSLTSLEFNMCYDLKQLPSGICNLVHLQKLSVTNCNELDVLPKRLGDLSNLESLSLRCCTKLQELPESIGSLRNMSLMDISDCLSISVLPEEIGELCGLQVFKMNGCIGLQELPMSISKLSQLQEVICDEETSYFWMDFESDLPDLKINVVEDDRLESFMKIVQ